ncbi:MAG: hypothetical protein A07HB70_02365, partial [uncultured archaeon A07HB70]
MRFGNCWDELVVLADGGQTDDTYP